MSNKVQPEKAAPKKKEAHFDEAMSEFVNNQLVTFHGLLSVHNMNKKNMCHEYDTAIEKMAQLNTILSTKIKQKMKAGTFGKDA